MDEKTGNERKTPLYDSHVALGGKMIPFAGYMLPVQYSGVIAEHMAVRTKAGLFDVSHMGEVYLAGRDALANLQNLMTNDFSRMSDGRVRYSLMCNDRGGIVDDLVVYRQDGERYLVVVNASNRRKDVEWMKACLFKDVCLEDASDDIAQLALQGPASKEILAKLTDPDKIPEKYYTFVEGLDVGGIRCLVSQTGYTGEHGYELYTSNADVTSLWNALLDAGTPLGLVPAGLGARDTLRLEAGMPLYGHEMTDETTPFEAGLAFAVKMDKEDFVGKSALESATEPARKRVGLAVTGRGIARGGEIVYVEDRAVGRTTSGTHCPYLGKPAAMASMERSFSEPGRAVEVEVRGRRIAAEVVSLPFYKKTK